MKIGAEKSGEVQAPAATGAGAVIAAAAVAVATVAAARVIVHGIGTVGVIRSRGHQSNATNENVKKSSNIGVGPVRGIDVAGRGHARGTGPARTENQAGNRELRKGGSDHNLKVNSGSHRSTMDRVPSGVLLLMEEE